MIYSFVIFITLQDNADESNSTDVLCQEMETIMIASNDTSLYVPSQTETTSSELSSDSRSSGNLSLRRTKLKEFLATSGKSTLTKPLANMLGRTWHVYVNKARDDVMAALEVIIPDDAGGRWEALKESGEVESALGVLSESHPADDKYLKSLPEAFQNASSWDT